jgi:hypothetical protein
VVLLTARLLLNPIPLSNVVPAVLIALIALAYLEEDGLLLTVGLLDAVMGPARSEQLMWLSPDR